MFTRIPAALLAAGVFLAPPAAAERLVVAPDGDLQAVINKAAEGDTVIVQGEHRGTLALTRTVTVEGEPGAPAWLGRARGALLR